MIRILRAAFAAALAVLCVPAFATTGWVTTYASHLTDFSGNVLNNATISFAPVNNQGQPISALIATSAGGQGVTTPVTVQVLVGAFSVQLADTALTNPVNVCYQVTVTDNSTGNVLMNYPCVQPSTTATWCSGTACDFDYYVPAAAPGTVIATGPQGPQGTAGGNGTNCASGGSPTNCTFNGTLDATVEVISPEWNGIEAQNYETYARAPLAGWLFSEKEADTLPLNVLVIGDSQSICYLSLSNCLAGPSNPLDRWPERVRLALQIGYGAGGSGLNPTINNVTWSLPNPQVYSVTGTYSQATGFGVGPSQSSSYASGAGLLQLSSGATLSWTSILPWDHFELYCGTNSGSGTLSLQVDGGSAFSPTICNSTTGSATAHLYTSSAYALQKHTVTATATGTAYIYGYRGTAAGVGISVSNVAVATAAAEFFGTNPTTQLAFTDLMPNGTQLVIIDLGTNDANQNFGYSTTSYANAVSAIIAHYQAMSSAPSILVVGPPVSIVATSAVWATYMTALAGVVNAKGVAFGNIQDRWGTTFAAAYFGTDQVHPNNYGSRDEAAQIIAQVLDTQVVAPLNGGSGGVNVLACTGTAAPGTANCTTNGAGSLATAACFTVSGNTCGVKSGLVLVTTAATGTAPTAGDQFIVDMSGLTSSMATCVIGSAAEASASPAALGVSLDETGVSTNGQFMGYTSSAPAANHPYVYTYVCP